MMQRTQKYHKLAITSRRAIGLLTATAGIIVLGATPVVAQNQTSGPDKQGADRDSRKEVELGDIVVTATKRNDTTLLNTPAAISVISGQEIEQSGAVSFNQFLQKVPGVALDSTNGPGSTVIQIRGLSTEFGAGQVGFYQCITRPFAVRS
jgi:iron complex outermembrane recepter protein